MDADAVRVLLRDVYSAAGGVHDDWDEYDRAMAADGRLAVLVSPHNGSWAIGHPPSGEASRQRASASWSSTRAGRA